MACGLSINMISERDRSVENLNIIDNIAKDEKIV